MKILVDYQPVTFTELQKLTGIQNQNMNYHLQKLLRKNLVFYQENENVKLYFTQPVFVNDKLLEYLTPFIDRIKKDTVFVDEDDEQCVVNTLSDVLEMFFALNVVEITKNGN